MPVFFFKPINKSYLTAIMKLFVVLICCLFSGYSYTQFNKQVSLVASTNFNFRTRGLGLNDAGLGLNVNAIVFAKHKLQLLLETSVDAFIGSKAFSYLDEGRLNKTPLFYTLKAGPQFFLFKHLALSATAGPASYSFESVGFMTACAFKFAVTGFLGQEKRLATSVILVKIPNKNIDIQYLGFQIGYRFR